MKLALCAGSFAEDIRKGHVSIDGIIELTKEYGFDAIEIREDLFTDKQNQLVHVKK